MPNKQFTIRHILPRISQLGFGRYPQLEQELELLSEQALLDLNRLLMDAEQKVSRASKVTSQNIRRAMMGR